VLTGLFAINHRQHGKEISCCKTGWRGLLNLIAKLAYVAGLGYPQKA
jgi:hypothetical protein